MTAPSDDVLERIGSKRVSMCILDMYTKTGDLDTSSCETTEEGDQLPVRRKLLTAEKAGKRRLTERKRVAEASLTRRCVP